MNSSSSNSNNNNNNSNGQQPHKSAMISPGAAAVRSSTGGSNNSTSPATLTTISSLLRNPPQHKNAFDGQQQQQQQHHWYLHWWEVVDDSSPSDKRNARIIYGRILFVVILCVVASVFGAVAYRLLTKSEVKLADTQFDSIADRALVEAFNIADRRKWAGVTMATILAELHPDASDWPFVPIWGFERLAYGLLGASSGLDMGISLLVDPEQIAEWEDFVYDIYDKVGFPDGTGTSPFGRGIWAVNDTYDPENYVRYHVNDGATAWNSSYDITTPVFRTDDGAHSVLMFNPHSDETRGRAVDSMLNCVEREVGQNSIDPSVPNQRCGIITDMIRVVKHNGRYGAAKFRPIFPRNDPTEMVGFVSNLILLDEMLENAFGDDVSGIDAVFETDTRAVTYAIINGEPKLVGEGDLHDREYNNEKQSIILTDDASHADQSPTYKLTLYPNDRFYEVYKTNNPWVASFGSVCVIVITSLCFFLYDFFVRREFHAKGELLQARRQFMRFVSHEVRTPLNSICMGLELVQAELARSLGFANASDAKAAEQHQTYSGYDDRTAETAREWEWFTLTQEIQSNAQGAIDILNDLLNYDKIEQGTLQLEERVVPIWDLLENSMLEFKLPATSKQINLTVSFGVQNDAGECSPDAIATVKSANELPEDLRDLKVIGDPVRITQVLRNLMSNALKFTPEGGSVHVKTIFSSGHVNQKQGKETNKKKIKEIDIGGNESLILHRSGQVQIIVTDTGAGMSEDQLANLFRDGVQFNVNQLQAGQGSGLGLFIAKGIVEQHSGSLSATSDGLGCGTSFTASLPVWEVSESSADQTDSGSKNGEYYSKNGLDNSSTHKAQSLKVLVVDDVASNRKLLSRLLQNAGHQCDGAGSGEEALASVATCMDNGEQYDCVLMDYEMPGMDGPTAARQIRDLPCDVVIVGITGNVLPEDVAYFKSCGANAVLSKPVRLSDIDCVWVEFGVYTRGQATPV